MSQGYNQRVSALTKKLSKDPGLPVSNPTASYWQQPAHPSIATAQSSSLLKSTDIAIIGSGISGCSVAHQILKEHPSLKVTILEARNITSGATGRNGGHIKAIPEHAYEDYINEQGLEATREIMRFWVANVHALLDLQKTLPPALQKASEIRAVESIEVFTNEYALNHFKNVLEGFNGSDPKLAHRGRMIGAEEVQTKYGFKNAVGAYVHPAGAAWPYRFITHLFASLLNQYPTRLTLESNTPVSKITPQPDGTYSITTPRGTLHAKQIVHATNSHAGHLNPGLRGPLFPVRGQMSAQQPGTWGVQGGSRSWGIHYGIGYDYVTQSGASGEIFLGGGLGQAEERGMGEIGNVRDDLQSELALAHVGGIINAVAGPGSVEKVKQTWTGTMGFTSDGLPLVGKLPELATGRRGGGEWITAGFNGWGMSNTWLCGKHLADCILQKADKEPVPRCYVVSEERLKTMNAEDGAKRWLAFLGMADLPADAPVMGVKSKL